MSVRCVSASDCFAAGYYYAPVSSNEVLHWNGRKWSVQTKPNSGTRAALAALACKTAASCWAFGGYNNGASETQAFVNEVLHWTGKQWTRVAVPNPGGVVGTPDLFAYNLLGGATCTSPNNCWAVGDYGNQADDAYENEALHWNGKKWSVVDTPNLAGTATNAGNSLQAVRCTSADNCWAVGGAEQPGQVGSDQILRWNGKGWAIVSISGG